MCNICEGNICFISKQPDPNHNHEMRWVVPYTKQMHCTCTKLLFGGTNMLAPLVAEDNFYVDEPLLFINTDNQEDLRRFLECDDVTSRLCDSTK